MSKAITNVDKYDADVERVYAMLTDRDFVLAKYDALGHMDVQVLEFAPTDKGGFRVSTQREVEAAGIPEIAKKVFGTKQTVTQTEEWSAAAADGSRTNTWTVITKGAPAKAWGGATLKPDGKGAVVTITGEIKISVPLIGGKIEGSAREVMEEQMAGEGKFGREWLAR